MNEPLNRLDQQIHFILEIDKLKHVFRRSYLLDGSRRENDAEHSWHLAVIAMLLWEYSATPSIDMMRVVRMALVHDMVEIDSGDIFIYDTAGQAAKHAREVEAADRIFNLLPPDQAVELRALWDEFEANETPEAKFANAVDRLEPLLDNYYTQGRAWLEHGVTADRVIAVNKAALEAGAPALWEYMARLIDDAVAKGYLAPKKE